MSGTSSLSQQSNPAPVHAGINLKSLLLVLAFVFPAGLAVGIVLLSRSQNTIPSVPTRTTPTLAQQTRVASSNSSFIAEKTAPPEKAAVSVRSNSSATAVVATALTDQLPPVKVPAIALTSVAPPPKTSKTTEIGPGGELVFHLVHGSISVFTTDRPKVEVNVAAQNDADAQFASEQVTVSREGNRVQVQASPEVNQEVCYQVFLPRKFNLDLKALEGEITITNIEGNVKVTTTEGRINMAKIQGNITAESPGGSIAVLSVTGLLKIKTAGGHIAVGETASETSLETAGGAIKVLLARAPLVAKTIGGNINVGAAFNSVKAETTGGSITVSFHGQPQGDCSLKSASGNVETKIAAKLTMTIGATSQRGKMVPGLPIAWQEKQKDRSYRGLMNGGGVVKMVLKSSSGDISVQPLPDAPLPSLEKDFTFFPAGQP